MNRSKVGFALNNLLNSAQDYDAFDVDVFLRDEPAAAFRVLGAPDSPMEAGKVAVLLQERAELSQRDILGFLGEFRDSRRVFAGDAVSIPSVGAIETFWINNSVSVEVTRDILEDLLERDDVAHVELAHYAETTELIDDRPRRSRRDSSTAATSSTASWSVKRVNAPLLWSLGLDGNGIVVAVVDSGVNYNHPDLASHMWTTAEYPKHGYDFASDDDDPMDEGSGTDGHGTACAGIVAGDGTSGKATGCAPKASIMAVRVGGAERSFWRGLEFAIAQGAHVISMSMTWKYPSNPNYPGWRRVCESILTAGIFHANSIGNQGNDLGGYPIPYNIATPGNCPPPRMHPDQPIAGGLSSAIACGATDSSDLLAGYSGRGPAAWETGPFVDYPWQGGAKAGLLKPDVCAPGPGTESCNWRYPALEPSKPYRSFGGTSAATPHVAGCLALLAHACVRSGNPLIPARVQEALENSARRIAGQTRAKENDYGCGRVDVFAAFNYGKSKGWWS
jgi:subtilisin family serine protease